MEDRLQRPATRPARRSIRAPSHFADTGCGAPLADRRLRDRGTDADTGPVCDRADPAAILNRTSIEQTWKTAKVGKRLRERDDRASSRPRICRESSPQR